MTLAEAIQRAHGGEQAGMLFLYQHTAASVWMTAFLLGCPEVGTSAISIYRKMEASVAELRSPSDMRVWLGRIVYAELLPAAAQTGRPIKHLGAELKSVYQVIAALPLEERMALLILCADGCSAPQAAEVLGLPDIEIKRAMRRARQTIAAQQKTIDDTKNCNTGWLIEQLAALREAVQTSCGEQMNAVLACLQSGETYHEEAFAETERTETESALPQENEEKGGFFHKLFRSKRFG